MELELPLLLVATLSALVTAAQAARARQWSWVVAAAIVLALGGLGALVSFAVGAWAAFAAWVALLLAPRLVGHALTAALHGQRYELASILGRLLVVLHPGARERAAAARLAVHALVARGAIDRAVLGLAAIEGRDGARSADARLDRLRLSERDEELAAAIDRATERDVELCPALVLAGLRGLSELGRRCDAIAWYARHERRLASASMSTARSLALAHVFALAGRRGELERLLRAQLPRVTGELRALWFALAEVAAEAPTGKTELVSLARAADGNVRRAARIYASRAQVLAADALGPLERDVVDRLARLVEQEDRYLLGAADPGRPWLTWTLGVFGLAVFAVEEALGGATDVEVLLALGALWPPAVLDAGEWHRLGAALVLHFGAAHVAMNTLALLAIAPFVERALGPARFFLVYASSGLAGTALYVASVFALGLEPGVLVGASGCIMGLVGATAAVLLRGARRERAPLARRRLGATAALVVLQTVFDLVTPQISLFAHATGALAGFLITAALADRITKDSPSSRIPIATPRA
jgi:rhomboid protease GluP